MIPPPGGLRIGEIGLTMPMLLVTAGLSIFTGLLFGLAPALAAFKVNLTGSLNESVRGTGTQSSGHRLRGALVAAQIALALVLLIGTGLLMKSVVRLAGRELNFDPQHVLSLRGAPSHRRLPIRPPACFAACRMARRVRRCRPWNASTTGCARSRAPNRWRAFLFLR